MGKSKTEDKKMTKINYATKRMLALFLAVLMMFSGMAVSASADGEATPDEPVTTPTSPAVPTSVSKPTLTKNDADKTITVELPKVTGYKVDIEVSPSANHVILNNGNYLYVNLTPGQTYTFKAFITKPDGNKLYSPAATEMIKEKLTTPAAPVATKVTSTTITVAKVTACEYRLVRVSDKKVIKDWSDTVVFEKLTADTAYTLSIRKKATSTKYASDPASITVKTLKAGDAKAVGTPVLVDKTDKTIVVKCAPEDADKKIEFSIDKGKTWQFSGEFKNLTPNTIYGIIARKDYDPAVQDPNPSSKILEIRTNTKPRVEASLSKCTFTLAEGRVYANEYIGVTVTGDGPDDVYLAEYGDTRFIPYSVIVDGEEVILTNGKGEILPGAKNANSKITVSVIYNVERYIGGGEWKEIGTIEAKHDIEVGPEKTVFTVIADFFVMIINFFADTLPKLILSTGGLWEKGLALLFGMFDKIGITK